MSGRVEGARGNREVPPHIDESRADLRGAWGAACLEEGGPRGKHGFPRASEPKASEAAEGFIRIAALETELAARRERRLATA